MTQLARRLSRLEADLLPRRQLLVLMSVRETGGSVDGPYVREDTGRRLATAEEIAAADRGDAGFAHVQRVIVDPPDAR